MSNCMTCGGSILEPNKPYSYAGPICNCIVPPRYQVKQGENVSFGQQHAFNPMSVPTYILDIINRLDRIENLLSRTFKEK